MSTFHTRNSRRNRFAVSLLTGWMLVQWVGNAAPAKAAQPAEESVLVLTQQGVVGGRLEEGLRVFRGIPYAAPPVGALRWRPTQPPAAWQGVRDATQFGAPCPMINGAKMAEGQWLKRGGADFFIDVPLLPEPVKTACI
jgi:hypothetical protein